MRVETLARLHALSFSTPRPWSATEFRDLLSTPHTFLLTEGEAFLLGRIVADEAELLTIAVPPDLRRQGTAKRLVSAFINRAHQRGATSAFLEVAEDNRPAHHLYANAGFVKSGDRRNYYRSPEGRYINAIVMIYTFD